MDESEVTAAMGELEAVAAKWEPTIGGMERPEWERREKIRRFEKDLHREHLQEDVKPWWILKNVGYDERTDHDVPEEFIERAYRGRPRDPRKIHAPELVPAESPPASPVRAASTPPRIMALQQDPRVLLKQADALMPKSAVRNDSDGTQSRGGWGISAMLKSVKETAVKVFGVSDSETDRYSDAADLYNNAALAFTNQREDLEAARAYERGANAALRAGLGHNATAYYENAWDRYKKVKEVREAIRCMEKAININATVQGNFVGAGKQQATLAAFYETQNTEAEEKTRKARLEDQPPPYALLMIAEAYQMAAEYYERGRFRTTGIPFAIRAAEIIALEGDLDTAARIMDAAIEQAANEKWAQTVKAMTEGALIHLASHDKTAFNEAMNHYCIKYREFSTLPIYQTIWAIEELYENANERQWKDYTERLEGQKVIDKFMKALLDKTWVRIEEKPEDFS